MVTEERVGEDDRQVDRPLPPQVLDDRLRGFLPGVAAAQRRAGAVAPAVTLAEAASGVSSSIRFIGSMSVSVRGWGATSWVWAGSPSGMALLLLLLGCSRRV